MGFGSGLGHRGGCWGEPEVPDSTARWGNGPDLTRCPASAWTARWGKSWPVMDLGRDAGRLSESLAVRRDGLEERVSGFWAIADGVSRPAPSESDVPVRAGTGASPESRPRGANPCVPSSARGRLAARTAGRGGLPWRGRLDAEPFHDFVYDLGRRVRDLARLQRR